MPLFEVFIPAAQPEGFNITARIRADSWIQALRSGLSRLGDTADVKNVMCDITEQGIDVTEPQSGRVFRIRELPETEAPVVAKPIAPPPAPVVVLAPPLPPQPIPMAPPAALQQPPPAILRAPLISAAPPPVAKSASIASPSPVGVKHSAPAPVVAPTPQPMPVDVGSITVPTPTTPKPAAVPVERFHALVDEETVKEERVAAGPALHIGRGKVEQGRTNEDIIAELFDKTQEMYNKADYREAAQYLLDLAQRHIPCDSGAVFISDIDRGDLFFAAATGPKAREVMKFRVGMGQGIVGFSALEAVSLAVSDVHRDPRFYAKISQSLGYETKSILCSPAQHGGRVFGAIELINKSTGTSFTGDEINLLNYLAHEFADYLQNTGQPGDTA